MATGESGIESGSLPAVNSTRSRFEQLAVADSSDHSRSKPSSPGIGNGFLPSSSATSRPRLPSWTLTPDASRNATPMSPTAALPTTPTAVHPHLRTSSSTSDLKGIRRPPPPPPTQRSPQIRAPSPSPSLLSRPVPPPGSISGSSSIYAATPHGSSGSISSIHAQQDLDQETLSPTMSFSSRRNIFANAQPTSPALPPGRPLTPKHHLVESVSFKDTDSIVSVDSTTSKHSITNKPKPMIPPRHNNTLHMHPRSVSSSSLSGSTSSSGHERSSSDASSDSSDSSPASIAPSLPPRTFAPSPFQSESDLSRITTVRPTPPPRPAPRHKVIAEAECITHSNSPTPPPLPARRPTISPDITPPGAPPLPCRPAAITVSPTSLFLESPPEQIPIVIPDRRPVGNGKLPPPPTRQIALGAPLPPVRPPSPRELDEDSESDDEEEPFVDVNNQLPDRSRASRRPPLLFPPPMKGADPRIYVPAFTGHVAISCPLVVLATGHHAKVFSLPCVSGSSSSSHPQPYTSPEPALNIDTRSFSLRDPPKLTAVEFRYSCRSDDRGRLIWVGTKDGHLFELDVRTGKVRGMRLSALSGIITHIWRRKTHMIVADDNGKVLVFDFDVNGSEEDIKLTQNSPMAKVIRINEKSDFLQFAGGRLWAACRSEMQAPGTTHRVPIIRVYDVINTGRISTVLPTQHVGAVTGATELDSGRVFLTHEEGFVTIWSIPPGEDPQCTDVVKVGMSDLTSCLGVCGKLWVGGRAGTINVYDVSQKPWVVTNSWFAHGKDLPVIKMKADLSVVEKADYGPQRWTGMGVLTVGRDETMRFWDGMLGQEWIDKELQKREAEFSVLRKIKILTLSWNCDAARPDDLSGSGANISLLSDMLSSVDSPDIISVGFQEVIDLESRKLAAKNVFMTAKRARALPVDDNIAGPSTVVGAGGDGRGLSESVTRAYRRWHEKLLTAVRLAMPPNCPYEVVHTESMVGLFTCVFVKSKDRILLRDPAINTVKRGMGGRYGNKGGILARFVIEDSSICLINCHLAAGQSAIRQRNADVASFLEARDLFPVASEQLAYSGGGDGTMVLDHEIVILNGDMNYRIDQRRDNVISVIKSGDYEGLHNHDQLIKEMKYNRGFRLRGFSEGPLTFAPTYKYDRRSNEYDTSEKRRTPAWCDRVLWRSFVPDRVKQLHYRRYEADVSDHRPISAGFEVTVKSVRHEVRKMVREEVEMLWKEEQKKVFKAEKDFYVRMGMI